MVSGYGQGSLSGESATLDRALRRFPAPTGPIRAQHIPVHIGNVQPGPQTQRIPIPSGANTHAHNQWLGNLRRGGRLSGGAGCQTRSSSAPIDRLAQHGIPPSPRARATRMQGSSALCGLSHEAARNSGYATRCPTGRGRISWAWATGWSTDQPRTSTRSRSSEGAGQYRYFFEISKGDASTLDQSRDESGMEQMREQADESG